MYRNQAWGPQSVDESEDDEVQGIFGRQNMGKHHNQGHLNSNDVNSTIESHPDGEIDDVVNRLNGLIAQDMFSGNASSFVETPKRSQLNANVPEYTPDSRQQMIYHQHMMMTAAMHQQQSSGVLDSSQQQAPHWQDSVRTKHRTPGPTGNGPSPQNPFGFGLGFNYPPRKTGLTPPSFTEDQQGPFSSAYGVPNFMQSPPPDPAHQGSDWYNQLPQGASPKYSSGFHGGHGMGDHDGMDGQNSFDYSGSGDEGSMKNLDFSAPFLQAVEEEIDAVTDFSDERGLAFPAGNQHFVVHQANYTPNAFNPSAAGFYGFEQFHPQNTNEFGGPGGNQHHSPQHQQQINQQSHRQDYQNSFYRGSASQRSPQYPLNDAHLHPSQLQEKSELQSNQSNGNAGRGGYGSATRAIGLGGNDARKYFGYDGVGEQDAGAMYGKVSSPPNYAKAAMQGSRGQYQGYQHQQHGAFPPQSIQHQQYLQQTQQQQQFNRQSMGSKDNLLQEQQQKKGSPKQISQGRNAPYFYENARQSPPHANLRVNPSENMHAVGDEEERKDKKEGFGSPGLSASSAIGVSRGGNVPFGGIAPNRRVSNSIDSSRSSASSSIDSQSSKEALSNKKRQDLEESPQTRTIFKDFYKTFRAKEKEGYDEAFSFANRCLKTDGIPEKIHWKIYLEMADLAKRENRFQEARKLYQLVNQTQPYAHQGWLEYSKMEEECGRLHQCRLILHQGLEYCNYAEQLLTKAIKHEERMGNLPGARALLARLRNQSVDKTWRTILEGALLEARAGNIVVARKVFKYLMRHVPWYGPIYYEATKFEEKNEDFERAIAIVEKGLKEIPRYGPLWFNAFRLHEKTEMELARSESATKVDTTMRVRLLRQEHESAIDLFEMFGITGEEFQAAPLTCPLLRTRGALQRAMNCISKELVWKVHFEAAQVAERGGGKDALDRARHAYVQSILRCPVNLRWKVWLAGARAELSHGFIDKARSLLDRALVDVPSKSKAQVLLECSRLEEYTGNLPEARKILAIARNETKHEWKVFLESVMLEVRHGRHEDAIRAAEDALAIHSGTGRLWAILVQLKHIHGPDAQRLVFREALKQVPKSGEVWCEGARIHMHPLSPHMDLDTAQRYLQFAIQFTPQYGDSFIIALRWQLLYANFGNGRLNAQDTSTVLDETTFSENMEKCDTSDLELKCVNADPNYGSLWFHCKRCPFDTARQVLRTAKKLLVAELTKFRYVYRDAILASIQRKQHSDVNAMDSGGSRARSKARTTPALANSENSWLLERLHHIPGAEKYCDFSSGLLCVNWLREHVDMLVDAERRKFLFGSDQIVP